MEKGKDTEKVATEVKAERGNAGRKERRNNFSFLPSDVLISTSDTSPQGRSGHENNVKNEDGMEGAKI